MSLCHGPGVAGEEQFVEVPFPLGLPGVDDLRIQQVVVHRLVDRAENADRLGELRIRHTAQQVGQARLGRLLVVEEQVVLRNAFA